MIRCVLLGASGFLGRQVRQRLATEERVELLTVARRSAAVDVLMDLATAGAAAVASMLASAAPTVVVNCAGTTAADPHRLVADNVVAVATLLEAIGRLDTAPRVAHIGSAAEYGPMPVGTAVTEATPPHPIGAYGVTKLAGTALVLEAAQHGLEATVLRIFNLIGPGAPANLLPGRLAAELRAASTTGEPAKVGSLAGHRDFVDVRDAAVAVAATATTSNILPSLLNVGSGRATSLREIAKKISLVAGGGSIVESAAGSPRSAGLTWQRADIGAIGLALDWRPTIDLETSIRDMWRAASTMPTVGGRRLP